MARTTTLRPLARAVLSTQSDERLVLLTREGNEEAFAEIVRRHRPGLLRFARSLGSGERSEDVVQDGLVRAWRALLGSDAEIDLRPWLTTIVRNRARSAHASARTHEQLDETIDGVRQPGEIALMREELRSAVSAVNSLPPGQREALVRSALQGESHEQIAATLETTPGAVRQLIYRARTGLRDGLGALVPLPFVRVLAELSAQGAAAGGTATGTVAAVAAGGGGSVALKAVTLVAVGAAVAGSGIAIERHRDGNAQTTPSEATAASNPARAAAGPTDAEPAIATKAAATAAAGGPLTIPGGDSSDGQVGGDGSAETPVDGAATEAQTPEAGTAPGSGGGHTADGPRQPGPQAPGADTAVALPPPAPGTDTDHGGGAHDGPGSGGPGGTQPQQTQPPPEQQQPYHGDHSQSFAPQTGP